MIVDHSGKKFEAELYDLMKVGKSDLPNLQYAYATLNRTVWPWRMRPMSASLTEAQT